ncbi:MAG: hypothetical protein ACJ790_04880 [Myxococcaceae bacterium]
MADALAEYPVVIALDVRWGDMDAFGHVNNTVVFSESQQAVAATGSGLVVSFDYGKQQKADLPAVVREKIEALRGTLTP